MKLVSIRAQVSSLPGIAKLTGLILVTTTSALGGQETFKLLPSDGSAGDQFGVSVAIDGNIAIIGAQDDEDFGPFTGSAYLFDVSTGQQLAKLLSNDAATGDRFGSSVAISGNTAIVGAHLDDDNGSYSGSAYLFDVTTGQQIAKLLPSDGESWDFFGRSVGISGGTAIVGSIYDDDYGAESGSAYLFDVATGQQIAKLLPNDGAFEDQFGTSVSISGNTAIVGSPLDGDNGAYSGSVYLFDVTTGQQIAKLLASDGGAGDAFGKSVTINGNTAIVGARWDDDNGLDSGSAYLFELTTLQQIAKLLPNDGGFDQSFGHSVSISGSAAIVGAFNDGDNGPGSGSAYLFDLATGQQMAKLLSSDGADSDWFGYSVAISDSGAIVGAYRHDDNGSDSGAIYVFDASSVGVSYCGPAVPNSTGGPSRIRGVGSNIAGANDVNLIADQLPQNQVGYFLNSISQGFTPNPGSSQGNICLAGAIGRYVGNSFDSGPAGSGSLQLDLANTPTPTGAVSVMAGQTWNFQCWYRDNNPGPTSNFTDAVSIAFQ